MTPGVIDVTYITRDGRKHQIVSVCNEPDDLESALRCIGMSIGLKVENAERLRLMLEEERK